MKSRVLSIRVPYTTIAYCYALHEKIGSSPKGKAVSTVIGDALYGIIEASRRMNSIPDMTDEEALRYIKSFEVARIPGFDAVSMVDALRAACPSVGDAPTEKPVGEKKPDLGPPKEVCWPEIDKAEPAQEGRDGLKLCRVTMPSGEVQEMYLTDEEIQDLELHGAELPAPTVSTDEVIAELAAAEEAKDSEQAMAAVVIGKIDRETPEQLPTIKPKCPWLGIPLIDEVLVNDDEFYIEACKVDHIMGLAARAVYAAAPREMWSSEKVIKLIQKTYSDFKKWQKEHGGDCEANMSGV